MTAEQAQTARGIRRAAGGALYGMGACHWCYFAVPGKALWCSQNCATDHANETRQLAAEAAQLAAPDHGSGL